MAKSSKKELSIEEQNAFLEVLKIRFHQNKKKPTGFDWADLQTKLKVEKEKLWSLFQMEETGGEPDLVGYDETTNEFIFYDCVAESPKGRRSFCYDRDALNARKENKPKNSALDVAAEMGIEILNEDDYRALQLLGNFDTKTSSWIHTPETIRKLGGAIFADFRYNTVFVYHNGAESYYAARGFRGKIKI